MGMIRVFDPGDMERVLAIWLDASIEAHGFIDRDFWESKIGDMRDLYLPNAETYVYDDGRTIEGFVCLNGDILAALFVSPPRQGQGIGTQLMRQARDVRQQLTLTVYKENHRAIAFYRACGFRIETERIDEHTGHLEIVMRSIQ